MQVVTETIIEKEPTEVWNLLLNSNVDQTIYCPIFCLGAPRPVKCEHNIGDIVGERKRRCVSNKGTIEQLIDIFEPPGHLAFHLVKTDLSVKACLTSMSDDFMLQPQAEGTRIKRTTTVDVSGRFSWLKLFMMWFGIKSVHNYVFTAWNKPLP